MVLEHLGHSVSGHIQMFWGTWSVLADFGIWGYLGGGKGGGGCLGQFGYLRVCLDLLVALKGVGGILGGSGSFGGYQSTRGTLGQFCSIFGNI